MLGAAEHEAQLDYIRRTPQIRDVLISGGDGLTLAPKLLERLGLLAPKRFKFAPGPIPEPARDDARGAPPRPPDPGPHERRRAELLAAGIGDDELRQLVARAAAASLARAPTDRSF